MSLFLSLILIQIVVFGILVAFLRVILKQNISKATSHITEMNQDYTQKIEDAQKRVHDADKYYDDIILKSKTDAEKTRVQILKDASDSQQLIVNQSRKQSEEILEKARKSGESILAEVDLMIAEKAIQKACELIQKMLPELMTKEMHESWVESLSKNDFDELDRLNVSREIREAIIVSAYALNPAEKTSLEKRIGAKLAREIRFKHEVDPGLIAGVKITLGSVVIDGSLKFKIKETARHA